MRSRRRLGRGAARRKGNSSSPNASISTLLASGRALGGAAVAAMGASAPQRLSMGARRAPVAHGSHTARAPHRCQRSDGSHEPEPEPEPEPGPVGPDRPDRHRQIARARWATGPPSREHLAGYLAGYLAGAEPPDRRGPTRSEDPGAATGAEDPEAAGVDGTGSHTDTDTDTDMDDAHGAEGAVTNAAGTDAGSEDAGTDGSANGAHRASKPVSILSSAPASEPRSTEPIPAASSTWAANASSACASARRPAAVSSSCTPRPSPATGWRRSNPARSSPPTIALIVARRTSAMAASAEARCGRSATRSSTRYCARERPASLDASSSSLDSRASARPVRTGAGRSPRPCTG